MSNEIAVAHHHPVSAEEAIATLHRSMQQNLPGSGMTPEASRAWNAWAKGVAVREVDKITRFLAEEIGKRIAGVQRELKEVRDANSELREQLAELRGELRGRQAATVSSLPALPPKLKAV